MSTSPRRALSFDAFTLAAAAAELRAATLGARVQKVSQPSPSEIVLALHSSRAGAQYVLLSVDPQQFRVHLTAIRRPSPPAPPAFCQVARKYLDGAWLDEITLPRFDRVLHLVFRTPDNERVTLIAELMGRNANLVLTSGAGVVRGALRPAPANSPRPLRPNLVYTDPPGFDERSDPLLASENDLAVFPAEAGAARTWLTTTFAGIGPFAADEILARGGKNGFVELMNNVRAERFAPHHLAGEDAHTIGVWAFAPLTVGPARRFARDSVSVALDTFYATRAEESAEETERTRLAKVLAREIAYRERELASANNTLAEASRAAQYEEMGNLLLANLALVERGARSVTLPNFYAADEPGAQATIALDPKMSPQENARRYFDRARKAREAAEHAAGRIEDFADALETLRGLAGDLAGASDAKDLSRLAGALQEFAGGAKKAPSPGGRKQTKPFDGHRVRTYHLDGYDLLVGETAEANDHLLTRVAAPTDLWMHIRSGTGAHGVLRTQNKPERVPDAVLRQAAALVAAKSGTSVKHAGLVAVDVVERKHVRKPRGAKPGLALYTRARTLDVSPALKD